MPLYSISYSYIYIAIYIGMLCISLPIRNNSFVSNTNGIVWNNDIRFQNLVISAVFLLFFGFRGFVLTDWKTYYLFYDELPRLWDKKDSFFNTSIYVTQYKWEKAFVWLSIFLKSFSPDYSVWQFYNVLIDFICLGVFFRKNVRKHFLLCFVFFFVYHGMSTEFNLLRNVKALSCFYISFEYLKKRKFLPYLIINTIGYLFHTSAIIFILLYFILNMNFHRQRVLLLFFIGNIVYFLRFPWIEIVFKKVFGNFKTIYFVFKLMEYTNNKTSAIISFGYVKRIIEFLIVFFYANKFLDYREHKFFYNAFYIYHFIYLFFYEVLVFTERFPLFFVFSYWIIFPKLYENLKLQGKKVFLIFFMFFSITYYLGGFRNVLYYYDNFLIGDSLGYTERNNNMLRFGRAKK